MICKKCNHEYPDTLDSCPICGEPKENSVPAPETPGAPHAETAHEEHVHGAPGIPHSEAHDAPAPPGAQPLQMPPPVSNAGTRPGSQGTGPNGAQGRPPYAGSQVAPPPLPPGERKNPVTPLVLGILSLIIPFAGIVLAILALVFGSAAKKTAAPGSTEYALANGGWILGLIGIIFQALGIIYIFTVIGFVMNAVTTAMSQFGSFGSGYEAIDPSIFY